MWILISKNHIGELSSTRFGTKMEVIDQLDSIYVVVKFLDEFEATKKIPYGCFKKGTVLNPYDKVAWGVGYLGEGPFLTCEGRKSPIMAYGVWKNILMRCYPERMRYKAPTYVGCTVCDEWLNYQNFAKWFTDNYYEIGEGRMHVDKDILFKNNRVYAPDKCLIVPQRINMIFQGQRRNKETPPGILKIRDKYSSSYGGKHIGIFDTLEEAVTEHDKRQKISIVEVANEYKNRIPQTVYEALLAY